METKIILPENVNDITLGQFQKYMEMQDKDLSDFDKLIRKVSIFIGLPISEVEKINLTDISEINNQIDKALTEPYTFTNRFFINALEFGFIPNFDKITAKEFFDLSEYQNKQKSLHNLMAILFRPIINKDKNNLYTISEYKGTEQMADIMKLMPLGVVNGALGFFLSLQSELESYILKFTMVEQVRE